MKIVFLLLLFVVILVCSREYFSGNVLVQSTEDGRHYFVINRQSHEDKVMAANKLAHIRRKIKVLIDAIANDTETMRDNGFRQLVSRWEKTEIEELNTREKGVFAFNINKGERISVCIRNNDMNDIIFVVLHELAHVVTKEIGHPQTFWDNYRTLLGLAIQHGVYTYKDYNAQSARYCGHYIESTPLNNNNK